MLAGLDREGRDRGLRPEMACRVAKLEETLKKAGLTKEQARRILSQWEKAGATDPDALRCVVAVHAYAKARRWHAREAHARHNARPSARAGVSS